MPTRRSSPTLLLAMLAVGGCHETRDSGPIEVSVIGPAVAKAHAAIDDGPIDTPAAVLTAATGQGLVRFDASGQIVPGLAARWAVSDGGRSLLFRLPDLPPPGRAAIDAGAVVRRLRAAIGPASRNPIKPLLGAIDEVTAVTPQVIDVELRAPRPNMLQLFAQPALAMGGGRLGPFAVVASRGDAVTIRALPDPDADPDDGAARAPDIRLRGEPAGRAVARFAAGRSRLVLGGSFADLPIARAAMLPRDALHLDPVKGLFGLAFADTATGFAANADNRRALAMAIDRDRIAQALNVPGWAPTPAIVAPGTPEIATPAMPSWAAMPLDARRDAAARIIAAQPSVPTLRVAMPGGPGARLLFALIADDWRRIGVAAVAVGPGEAADLRLVDAVAPADVASFYLRAFACDQRVPCTPVSDQLLMAARYAPTLAERSALLVQADALITQGTPFIALGPPVRWSLVRADLDLYRDSPRGLHPLNELRSPLKR
jgi:peptide/nickel transport system substrate-binding protein